MFKYRDYILQQIENSGWWRVFFNGSIVATLINKEEARRFIWLQYKDREDIDCVSENDLEIIDTKHKSVR